MNVLRRWFEKFRSVYIIAEEYGATDAPTACCVDATVPQKPQFLVAFVVSFQKTEETNWNSALIHVLALHSSSLTCAALNAMNVRVLVMPKPIPKLLVQMKCNQLRATVQHLVPCSFLDSPNASTKIPLYRDDDGNHCHASHADALHNRIPFYISRTLHPFWIEYLGLLFFRRRSFGCADAVIWPTCHCLLCLCCCTNCFRYGCD